MVFGLGKKQKAIAGKNPAAPMSQDAMAMLQQMAQDNGVGAPQASPMAPKLTPNSGRNMHDGDDTAGRGKSSARGAKPKKTREEKKPKWLQRGRTRPA